jgi:cytochrome P450
MNAVLKETLRLQSTAPGFILASKEDNVILPGGYEVHKDDSITVLNVIQKYGIDQKNLSRNEC